VNRTVVRGDWFLRGFESVSRFLDPIGFVTRQRDQEKLRSFPQIFGIGALSWQKVTGAPCSRPATWYGTVRCAISCDDMHIQATSDGW
jgi:hypothetical protein